MRLKILYVGVLRAAFRFFTRTDVYVKASTTFPVAPLRFCSKSLQKSETWIKPATLTTISSCTLTLTRSRGNRFADRNIISWSLYAPWSVKGCHSLARHLIKETRKKFSRDSFQGVKTIIVCTSRLSYFVQALRLLHLQKYNSKHRQFVVILLWQYTIGSRSYSVLFD